MYVMYLYFCLFACAHTFADIGAGPNSMFFGDDDDDDVE